MNYALDNFVCVYMDILPVARIFKTSMACVSGSVGKRFVYRMVNNNNHENTNSQATFSLYEFLVIDAFL